MVIRISGDSKRFSRELGKVESSARATSRKLIRISAVTFAAAAAGATVAIRAFASYETALIGVSKTTGIVGKELEELGESAKQTAEEMGVSSTQVLNVAQAAGQLGVKGAKNIQNFTDTIIKLGKASNLQGEAAATTLARLINITGGAIEEVDVLASVIVRLGNNFAATESEIAFMALQIAKAGAQFGVTAEQAAALGAAFASLGVQPEIARTAVLQTMIAIKTSLTEGGKNFKAFQKITGLTGDQLKKTFEEDATEVFRLFLTGLKRTGSDSIAVLKKLGLGNIRLAATLPAMAGGIDIVNDALQQQQEELTNTTALQEEFDAAQESAQTKINQTREAFRNASIEIGESFIPLMETTTELLKDLAPIISDFVVPAINGLLTGLRAIAFTMSEIIDLVKKMRGQTKGQKLFTRVKTDFEGDPIGDDFSADIAFGGQFKPISAENLEEALKKRKEFFDAELALIEEQEESKIKIKTDAKAAAQDLGVADIFGDTDEAFEKSLKTHKERLETIQDQRDIFADKDLKTAKFVLDNKDKFSKEEVKLATEVVDEKSRLAQIEVTREFAKLGMLVAGNSKAAKAFVIVAKAADIAQSIMSIQTGIAKAQELPFPANLAEMARIIALGAAIISTIKGVGTDIPTPSFAIGSFNVPSDMNANIHRGEMILPEPFADTVRSAILGQGGGGGSQGVAVQIDLTDRASEFVTVNQREDAKLGIQR